jgi:hypothetical protein
MMTRGIYANTDAVIYNIRTRICKVGISLLDICIRDIFFTILSVQLLQLLSDISK